MQIGKCAGRKYELGPEPGPEPDDIDGRSPAVVWHEGEMHYLVASHEVLVVELVRIARSFDDRYQRTR